MRVGIGFDLPIRLFRSADSASFNIGMIVACTTCHGHKIKGEVIAFDQESKLLSLKSSASSGKPNVNDVRLVNLAFVSEIEVIREASHNEPAPLPNLNLNKLAVRVKSSVDAKRRQAEYIGDGVSPQAQKLFLAITKTISEIKWSGQDIVVMDKVIITPPYRTDNCQATETDATTLNAHKHVCKIVEKYYSDQESRESPASTTSSSSSS